MFMRVESAEETCASKRATYSSIRHQETYFGRKRAEGSSLRQLLLRPRQTPGRLERATKCTPEDLIPSRGSESELPNPPDFEPRMGSVKEGCVGGLTRYYLTTFSSSVLFL